MSCEIVGYSMPVEAPSYVDERIRMLAWKCGIEFRYKLTETGMTSIRVKGTEYTSINGAEKIKIIEIPVSASRMYVVNCAILHEIAKLELFKGRKEIRSKYGAETSIWLKADALRERCGYPEKDEEDGENWDGIRTAIVGATRRDSDASEKILVSLKSILSTSCLLVIGVLGLILTLIAVAAFSCGYGLSFFLDVINETKGILAFGAIALVGCAIVIEMNEIRELEKRNDEV